MAQSPSPRVDHVDRMAASLASAAARLTTWRRPSVRETAPDPITSPRSRRELAAEVMECERLAEEVQVRCGPGIEAAQEAWNHAVQEERQRKNDFHLALGRRDQELHDLQHRRSRAEAALVASTPKCIHDFREEVRRAQAATNAARLVPERVSRARSERLVQMFDVTARLNLTGAEGDELVARLDDLWRSIPGHEYFQGAEE